MSAIYMPVYVPLTQLQMQQLQAAGIQTQGRRSRNDTALLLPNMLFDTGNEIWAKVSRALAYIGYKPVFIEHHARGVRPLHTPIPQTAEYLAGDILPMNTPFGGIFVTDWRRIAPSAAAQRAEHAARLRRIAQREAARAGVDADALPRRLLSSTELWGVVPSLHHLDDSDNGGTHADDGVSSVLRTGPRSAARSFATSFKTADNDSSYNEPVSFELASTATDSSDGNGDGDGDGADTATISEDARSEYMPWLYESSR